MRCIRILFVCLGNTCRSPMAETIMKSYCRKLELSWIIDSAALRSWNVGRCPDERCLKVFEENHLSTEHYTRMLNWSDFQNFDYIICMDESNVNELKAMSQMVGETCKAQIQHLALYLFHKGERTIKDPFCTLGLNGFRRTFDQISCCCRRLSIVIYYSEHHGFRLIWNNIWKYLSLPTPTFLNPVPETKSTAL